MPPSSKDFKCIQLGRLGTLFWNILRDLGSWDLVYLGRPYPILPHHIAGPEKNNSTILDKFNNKSFVTWVFYVEFWPDFNIQNQSPS